MVGGDWSLLASGQVEASIVILEHIISLRSYSGATGSTVSTYFRFSYVCPSCLDKVSSYARRSLRGWFSFWHVPSESGKPIFNGSSVTLYQWRKIMRYEYPFLFHHYSFYSRNSRPSFLTRTARFLHDLEYTDSPLRLKQKLSRNIVSFNQLFSMEAILYFIRKIQF